MFLGFLRYFMMSVIACFTTPVSLTRNNLCTTVIPLRTRITQTTLIGHELKNGTRDTVIGHIKLSGEYICPTGYSDLLDAELTSWGLHLLEPALDDLIAVMTFTLTKLSNVSSP